MTGQVKKIPDTNTILRYLLKDDNQLFKRASELFEKVRTGDEKVIILESVFVECVYVLKKFYQVPDDEISEKLKGFLLYKGIVNEDKKELIDALNIFSRYNLDIVDCLLCAKAYRSHFYIFTFDEKLKKIMLTMSRQS